jgi:hypothetical protein
LLDIFLRRCKHRRDVQIVVFLVILKQQILDRANIECPLRGFGNVIFSTGAGQASGSARTGLKAIESVTTAAAAIIIGRGRVMSIST